MSAHRGRWQRGRPLDRAVRRVDLVASCRLGFLLLPYCCLGVYRRNVRAWVTTTGQAYWTKPKGCHKDSETLQICRKFNFHREDWAYQAQPSAPSPRPGLNGRPNARGQAKFPEYRSSAQRESDCLRVVAAVLTRAGLARRIAWPLSFMISRGVSPSSRFIQCAMWL